MRDWRQRGGSVDSLAARGTAVVVGGTPLSGGRVRVGGTVAGAVLIQLLTATLIKHDLPPSWTQIAQAVVIILAVYAARERGKR